MKTSREQVLECVERWLKPEIQEMIAPSMTERERDLINKIVTNIAIAIRSLPE